MSTRTNFALADLIQAANALANYREVFAGERLNRQDVVEVLEEQVKRLESFPRFDELEMLIAVDQNALPWVYGHDLMQKHLHYCGTLLNISAAGAFILRSTGDGFWLQENLGRGDDVVSYKF